jgi:hypothetical protein
VALDLGLVAHAAHREAVEAPAQGLGDGPAQGRLADARRAHQTDDGAGHVALHDAERQKLEDSALDVLEAFVVPVEHPGRRFQIAGVLGVNPPGHAGQPVEVVAGHRVLGGAELEQRQLLEFLVDLPLGRLRYRAALEAPFELVDLGGLVVFRQPQLLLNELELLAQERLALMALDLRLDVLADVHLRLGDLHLLVQQLDHLLEAPLHRDGFQHVLQVGFAGGGEAGGEVGQQRRLVGVGAGQEHFELLPVQRVEGDQLLDDVDDGDRIGLLLLRAGLAALGEVLDVDQQRRRAAQPVAHPEALQALQQHLQLIAFPVNAMDTADGAHVVEVGGTGHVVDVVAGGDQADHVLLAIADRFQGRHPHFGVHDQRNGLTRKERPVLLGQHVDVAGSTSLGRMICLPSVLSPPTTSPC